MTTSEQITDKPGSLLVVGTGLTAGGQLTFEAHSAISHADKVFYGDSNPVIIEQIQSLNANSQTLLDLYGTGKPRHVTYGQMAQRVLGAVREGMNVCAVFYGHPGIFATVPHEVIRAARSEGYPARMLAGISAEDCLFADLLIDPGQWGCLSYEATDFLINRRPYDRRSVLVLWQVGGIGRTDFQGKRFAGDNGGVAMLVDELLEHYPADHLAIIYEASQFVVFHPRMESVAIGELASADLTTTSTLVIVPAPEWHGEAVDMDRARRLGLEDYLLEGRTNGGSPARTDQQRPLEHQPTVT